MANITIDETINIGDQLRITFDGVDYDGYIDSYGNFTLLNSTYTSLPFYLQVQTNTGTTAQ